MTKFYSDEPQPLNPEYIKAQMFFLNCAFCSGLLDKDHKGRIIPNHGENVIRVSNIEWLKSNSPTYFKYWSKSGRVQFKTPQQVLENVWEQVGLL